MFRIVVRFGSLVGVGGLAGSALVLVSATRRQDKSADWETVVQCGFIAGVLSLAGLLFLRPLTRLDWLLFLGGACAAGVYAYLHVEDVADLIFTYSGLGALFFGLPLAVLVRGYQIVTDALFPSWRALPDEPPVPEQPAQPMDGADGADEEGEAGGADEEGEASPGSDCDNGETSLALS